MLSIIAHFSVNLFHRFVFISQPILTLSILHSHLLPPFDLLTLAILPLPPPRSSVLLLRPVMARVAATPTPSPPPPWWVTEICGSRRWTGEAASTHVR